MLKKYLEKYSVVCFEVRLQKSIAVEEVIKIASIILVLVQEETLPKLC